MPKFAVTDLKKIKQQRAGRLAFQDKTYLMLCGGTGCHATGSIRVKEILQQALEAKGLQDKVEIVETGCNGFCAMGPIMVVHPGNIFYQKIKLEDIAEIVESHLINGKPVEKNLYKDPATKKTIASLDDIPFFSHQEPVALRNKGLIDPESIEDYIGRDGYLGAAKALLEMQPAEIIEQMKISGLRGRGGAGFPTGRKWRLARAAPGPVKYIICNADEGDPGAYMDRSVLEGDPYAILEGMAIGAFAIGAEQGIIYVRDEYPLAIAKLETAVKEARAHGLLGKDIMGKGHKFDLRLVRGGGAFVCGEETALIASVEGRPGEPRQRPPFPAEKGLWGKPTVINNVETWANVPFILSAERQGQFAELGTRTSKGTKVFSIVGKIVNTGLIEVPMGIKLRDIIYDIGEGVPDGKKFKAIQTGGPSGGCIPEEMLDLPVDYESLTQAGAIMGSGGMIVMDQDTCMVDVARYFLDFLKEESCGKCSPCREGIDRALEILNRITKGKGKHGDLEMLESIGKMMKGFSLCALGQTAPNPLLSTLRYFRGEYEAHIRDQRCPAGVCRDLIRFSISAEKCNGCGACVKACTQGAITGAKKKPHRLDQALCIKCGMCYDVCKQDAVVKE
jgi:NADH:ubiquinone oxidoreductase subunit F (NADH-binding)/(2Fe-2S) ferredoxin/NAD-dependent dihydropyrimidine dehydrogenase PreA subunit